MLLGVHILVCNEEAVLGRCLSSVREIADEIVVTDTGSADASADIARSFGARVVQAAWEEDFAAARNAGLDAARTTWALVLDADEWVNGEVDRTALRRMLRNTEGDCFSVRIESLYGNGGGESLAHGAPRLFRTDAGLRYAGVIHEQLVRGVGERVETADGPSCGLQLLHDGYLPEIMKRKSKAERNLRLIGKALSLTPDDPFQLYNRGVTLCQLNKPENACEAFARACLFAPMDAPYRARLLCDWTKALLALGDVEGAARMLQREVGRYAGDADVQLAYGEALLAERRPLDARAAFEAALRAGGKGAVSGVGTAVDGVAGQGAIGGAAAKGESGCGVAGANAAGGVRAGAVREAGAGSYRARCGLAAAEAALGRREQALRAYAAAAAEAPRYRPALAGWAEQLQAAGERDEAIRDALAARMGAPAPGDAALLARVLGGIGAHAAAVPLWRKAEPLPREELRAYAASLAGSGDLGAARSLLLEALIEGTEEADGAGGAEIAAQWCADAALYGWEAGKPMGGALRKIMANGAGLEELALLLDAAERFGAPYEAKRGIRVSGVDAALPGWVSFLGLLLERSLELGLLRLAGRLRDAAPGLGARYGTALFRHGYATAAADFLLGVMEERGLAAEERIIFGEILLLKGFYGEALAMFEAAVADGAQEERARLGAAFCSLALAKEALAPWAVDPAWAAAQGGGWPLADLEQLQLAMVRMEAMGWRTTWSAAQRRRANVSENEADHPVHDRQK